MKVLVFALLACLSDRSTAQMQDFSPAYGANVERAVRNPLQKAADVYDKGWGFERYKCVLTATIRNISYSAAIKVLPEQVSNQGCYDVAKAVSDDIEAEVSSEAYLMIGGLFRAKI